MCRRMQSGRKSRSGSWSRTIVATLLVVVVSALGAEFSARSFFNLQTLQYGRVYSPLFVSGDSDRKSVV